jgi:hypothetical protein
MKPDRSRVNKTGHLDLLTTDPAFVLSLVCDLFECISAKGRAAMVYKRLNSAKG